MKNLTVVDIGARGGLHPRWVIGEPHVTAVLFEPDAQAFARLAPRTSFVLINVALSDTAGDRDFFVCRAAELSSMYEPNFSVLRHFAEASSFAVVEKCKRATDSLDNQLSVHAVADVDFIKIDVEGHELPILRGAERALNQVIGLEVEVSFLEVYQGQALFDQVYRFVAQRGFELFDLRRYYWQRRDLPKGVVGRKGQLVSGDALFLRPPTTVCTFPLLDDGKLRNAVKVYLAYGYPDLACELVELALAQGIIPSSLHQSLQEMICTCARRWLLPDFKGKRSMHRLLLKLAELCVSKSRYQPDQRLGN